MYLVFTSLLTWWLATLFGGASQAAATQSLCYALYTALAAATLLHMVRDLALDLGAVTRSQTKLSTTLLSTLPDLLTAVFVLTVLILTSALEDPRGVLALAIALLLALLALVELLQLSVSLKRYILSLENWIEVAMIAIVAFLLSNRAGDFELNRSLAGIAILLSWAKAITLIGKHPKHNTLNIYVTMFFTVLKSFFSFLLWYGLFIVAFGISFYLMLHTDIEGRAPTGEDEYAYFNTTFLSVVKTLTMFVGELEFSDIPINLGSPLYPVNYLFFLLFVFLIVVVLMNLLNGLAVSDTGRIREQAEVYAHLSRSSSSSSSFSSSPYSSSSSRVETIAYLESVLLGDPFDFLSNVPRLLAWLPPFSLLRQVT